jgi:hypothetical protein
MKVLIIGNAVGHEVQKEIVDHDSLADEKQRFRAFLEERILQHRAEFIAEETLPNTRTIANQLGIPWANIDMPQEIREALGIAKEQNSRGRVPEYLGEGARSGLTDLGYQIDCGDGWVATEPRLPSDAVREDYMFERTTQESGGKDSIILICGVNHCRELAKRFRSKYGGHVEVELWERMK